MLDYDINAAHWILIYLEYTLQMTLVLDTVGGRQLHKYWGHNLYAFFF
jgi:hypothetical protein